MLSLFIPPGSGGEPAPAVTHHAAAAVASGPPNLNTYLVVLVAIIGLVTALLGLYNARRIKRTEGKVQEISVHVDGRLSDLLERQAQLLGALHDSGTAVPPRPELTAEDERITGH
jgi:hypothetical protein